MADTREITNRHKGIGVAQMLVLQSIAAGRATEMDVRLALKQHVSGPAAGTLIQRLRSAGLIGWHRAGGRYYVTAKGRAQMPEMQLGAVLMRPYVPPQQPPRRAGSMTFAGLPSVAADRQIGWRQPC